MFCVLFKLIRTKYVHADGFPQMEFTHMVGNTSIGSLHLQLGHKGKGILDGAHIHRSCMYRASPRGADICGAYFYYLKLQLPFVCVHTCFCVCVCNPPFFFDTTVGPQPNLAHIFG